MQILRAKEGDRPLKEIETEKEIAADDRDGPDEPVSIPIIVVSGQEEGELGSGMKCSVERVPVVVLSRQALVQMLSYVSATSLEVSALGVVEKDGAVFRVSRFHLVDQKSTGAGVELIEESVGKLVEELAGEGKSGEVKRLRCWLHSHPRMKAFWSGTDDSTCRLLGGEYLVSIVVGLESGQPPVVKCRIDLSGSIPITLDDVPVLAEVSENEAEIRLYADEVSAKVKPDLMPCALSLSGARRDLGKGRSGVEDELSWWYGTGEEPRADIDDPFFY